ncbi:MAG: class A beta-lactamase, subclass A2 [Chitinophagaceae bacterium]
MKLLLVPCAIALVMNSSRLQAQQPGDTRAAIAKIAADAQGKVGVAVMNLESGDTLSFNGTMRLPMQSVFKFPIAMAVLNEVDRGKLSLNKKVHVKKKELLVKIWSPLLEKYTTDEFDITIAELLLYTVSQSDNNGCDILLKEIGGAKKVDGYIRSLGIKGMAIKASEKEMQSAWSVQYTNWCEPVAMIQLLKIFYQGKALQKSSNDLLWKWMVETATGPERIKGLLGKDVVVAHKTGTSGTNNDGITAATNDVGIVVLGNNLHLAVAVFVSDAEANQSVRENVIARIAQLVCDRK